jgi:hypothetical protein
MAALQKASAGEERHLRLQAQEAQAAAERAEDRCARPAWV